MGVGARLPVTGTVYEPFRLPLSMKKVAKHPRLCLRRKEGVMSQVLALASLGLVVVAALDSITLAFLVGG